MTRKDYEMLAGVFRREIMMHAGKAYQQHGHQYLVKTSVALPKLNAVRFLALTVADALKVDDERFDNQVFLNACGLHPCGVPKREVVEAYVEKTYGHRTRV